jgi:AI-2 transport protein TqsA
MSLETKNDFTVISSCLIILTGLAISFALYFSRPILVPFTFAIFLSYAINPIAEFLQARMRLSKNFSVCIAIFCGLLILSIIGLLLYSSVSGLADNMKLYQKKVGHLAGSFINSLERFFGDLDSNAIQKTFGDLPVAGLIERTVGSFAEILTNIVLIIVFVIYLVFGRNPNKVTRGIFREVDEKVKKYIAPKIIISAITGFLVGLTLWLLGLNLALAFGVLAFLLNLIPNIGSIIATLLPIPLALVQFDSFIRILLVLIIPGAIQLTIGNFIEPKILGSSLELHPVTILLALIFWGMVWGVMGLFLAAPITAVIKIILEQIEYTHPVANLMAGKL